tara:strand:+ start:282 stop:524 length:243 start_codon:yes stop_codon:yes gene_type:complete
MTQFEYDAVMKRYNVKVPQTIAGETSMLTIAYISEDSKFILLREMKIEFVRNILLQWEEYEYQMTRELDELIDNKKKGDK